MMATVSSVEIVTHGLSTASVLRLACALANCRPEATAKVSPAAPTINPRRLISALRVAMVMALALLRGALYGAHDAGIGSAAADIGAHMGDDLVAIGLRILRQ